MTREYLNIACSPLCEDCKQVGLDSEESIKKEVYDFLAFLKNYCLDSLVPEELVDNLRVKRFSHDFGSYYEVVCFYDEDKEEEARFAFWLESNTPEFWTDTRASKPYIGESYDE